MRAGLRGRPDAALHAHRQAARQHLRGRDADRPVPHVHAAASTCATSNRFEAGDEVTPETLKAKGLIRSIRKDVKLLGVGELTKKLTITVHGASATAREKVEAAGGTLTVLREPKPRKPKNLEAPPRGPHEGRRAGSRGGPRRGRGGRGLGRAVLARQRLAGPGAAAPAPLHGRRSSRSTGSARGCPRRASTPQQIENFFNGTRRLAARPAEPLLGLARCRGSRSSRSGSCRTSRPRSSCSS